MGEIRGWEHDIKNKKEIVNCASCGKKIWIYWMNKKKGSRNIDREPAKKCALCYFKRI